MSAPSAAASLQFTPFAGSAPRGANREQDMSDIAWSDISRRDRERHREFRFLVLASYPLFLVDALGKRLSGRAAGGRHRSVFAEALASAYRTIPYAF